MPKLGTVYPGLLRKNRYLLKTATDGVSGLDRKRSAIKGKAGVRKNPGIVQTTHPKSVHFVGSEKLIESSFSESGERVIARTLAHQLQNPKTAFKVDIACAVERIYRGTKVDMNGKKYSVTVSMVTGILKRMIEKKLISESVL